MADLSTYLVTGENNPDKQVSVTFWNAFINALEEAVGDAGTGSFQPVDSDLTAIAALTTTAFGRSLLTLADAAALAALHNHDASYAAIGHNHDGSYQPLDSDLTAIAALSTTSFGRSLLALADAAALRTAAGLGTAATQSTGTFLQAANNLSDVANATTARTNLAARAAAPSIQTVTSSATVTPTFSDDMVKITAQAAALALANPTGTAVPGWGWAIRIKDNGTARAISYDTQYRAIGVTLPTTTVLSKTLYLGCIWNSDDSKVDVVAVAQEA